MRLVGHWAMSNRYRARIYPRDTGIFGWSGGFGGGGGVFAQRAAFVFTIPTLTPHLPSPEEPPKSTRVDRKPFLARCISLNSTSRDSWGGGGGTSRQ